MSTTTIVRAAGALLLLASAPAAAAPPKVAAGEASDLARKSITAVRTDHPPRIDGKLDDPAWAAAPPETRFTQWFPAEGKPPSNPIDLRILYDDNALYVGVRLYDREPDKIVARLTRRDRIPESDAVIVRLDSRHDHATAYVFRLHASGVQFDNFFFDDGNGASPEWDAVWAGEVTIDQGGWTAEYRIPLGALRFAGLPDEMWGLQVVRYTSRTGEVDVWSYWPSTQRGEVSHYDHIVGLHDLRSHRTVELRPYVLGRLRGSSGAGTTLLGGTNGDRSGAGDAGLDLKLGLTSQLTLDLTLNPDFGQVEADQVVLNLSRFETFLPEKRPFFLEGTDLFRTPIQLFYSRRIGRAPTGFRSGKTVRSGTETVTVRDSNPWLRIWGAAKVTGKIGRKLSLGMLSALTDAERISVGTPDRPAREVWLAPPRSYNVLRTRLSLGGPSYLGLMATGVSRLDGHLYRARDDHDAYAESLDGQWQSPGAQWRIGGQGVLTERVGGVSNATSFGTPCPDPTATPGCVPITRTDGTKLVPGGLGYGGTFRISHMGDHDIEETSADLYSPLLDPNDAGFLTDYNKQRAGATLGYQERQPGAVMQNFNITMNQTVAYDFTHAEIGRGTRLGTRTGLDFGGQLVSFWYLSGGVGYEWPGTWDRDETFDGARFQRPPRATVNAYVATDSRKRVTGDLSFFYSRAVRDPAYGYDLSGSLIFRVFSQLELSVAQGVNWDASATRFYDCHDDAGAACIVDTDVRHYRFAGLDSGSLSTTVRATLALSPTLSLQVYGQLFLAQGQYSDYRLVDTKGLRPVIYRGDLRRTTTFTGDTDGDGVKDDDFEQLSLNGNAVLRWEIFPGSSLFLVYTRSQSAAPVLAGRPPGFHVRGLTTGPTEDIIALKLVFYLAP